MNPKVEFVIKIRERHRLLIDLGYLLQHGNTYEEAVKVIKRQSRRNFDLIEVLEKWHSKDPEDQKQVSNWRTSLMYLPESRYILFCLSFLGTSDAPAVLLTLERYAPHLYYSLGYFISSVAVCAEKLDYDIDYVLMVALLHYKPDSAEGQLIAESMNRRTYRAIMKECEGDRVAAMHVTESAKGQRMSAGAFALAEQDLSEETFFEFCDSCGGTITHILLSHHADIQAWLIQRKEAYDRVAAFWQKCSHSS